MARLNLAFMYGLIEKEPFIRKDENGEPVHAMSYVHVVRGYRDDHANKYYMKHDHPLVISLEKKQVKEMATWKPNDTVLIKGTITSKFIDKPSYCPTCRDENGNSVVNMAKGILMFVTPVFCRKIAHFDTKDEAVKDIIKSREVSNLAYLHGYLIKDPTYFKTKHETIVTQYQIGADRKLRIRTDSPDIRTDWPYIKSYGDQAIEDKMRLRQGSEIYLDGVVQARTVHRKTKCRCCGQIYEWEDQTMELVPYAVEYITNYMTDNMLEQEKGKMAEDIRQELFDFFVKDTITEDENSEDIDLSTVASEPGKPKQKSVEKVS